MKLLIEEIEPSLVESTHIIKGDEKKYFIEGIFAQAELKNRNGRLYPKSVMETAIATYQKLIDDKRSISELNHPEYPTVNPERASHIIESLTWDGTDVRGRARVLTEMPMGKIVKALIDEGVKFGVSTRGLGSLSEKAGSRIVQSDFMLTAIDVVGDPSAPGAFVSGLMEDADWVWNATSKSWVMAEQIVKVVKKMPTKQIVEHQANMFAKFLDSIG